MLEYLDIFPTYTDPMWDKSKLWTQEEINEFSRKKLENNPELREKATPEALIALYLRSILARNGQLSSQRKKL